MTTTKTSLRRKWNFSEMTSDDIAEFCLGLDHRITQLENLERPTVILDEKGNHLWSNFTGVQEELEQFYKDIGDRPKEKDRYQLELPI